MWRYFMLLWVVTLISFSSGMLRRPSPDVALFNEINRSPNTKSTRRIDIWMKYVNETLSRTQNYYGPQFQGKNYRRQLKSARRIQNAHMGVIDKQSLRIKAGVNVSDTMNYPYMAAIIINGRLWCAGAIVDVNWVVTAAHCLNFVLHVSPLKTLGQYVKVRVGSTKVHEDGKLVEVAGAVRHPKFEEEPVPHADVALLKLAENLIFSEHINLIRIYAGVKLPLAQSFITVSGWGATRGVDTAFREHTSNLLTARLKVRTQNYCIDAYQLVNGFQFTRDFFCASLRNGTRDACLFDAGAPAVLNNMLVGIMSFGPEHCGDPHQPAVFTKAFYFRDFVKSTIVSYKTNNELMDAMMDANEENEGYGLYEVASVNRRKQQGEYVANRVVENTPGRD